MQLAAFTKHNVCLNTQKAVSVCACLRSLNLSRRQSHLQVVHHIAGLDLNLHDLAAQML